MDNNGNNNGNNNANHNDRVNNFGIVTFVLNRNNGNNCNNDDNDNNDIFNFEFLVSNFDYDNFDDLTDLNDDSGTNLYGCKVMAQLMVVGLILIIPKRVCVRGVDLFWFSFMMNMLSIKTNKRIIPVRKNVLLEVIILSLKISRGVGYHIIC